MKYSLWSLMVVVLVLPPLLAGGWSLWRRYSESRHAESVNLWKPELIKTGHQFVRRLDYRKAAP
jgi:hypothetical protein